MRVMLLKEHIAYLLMILFYFFNVLNVSIMILDILLQVTNLLHLGILHFCVSISQFSSLIINQERGELK